VDEEELQLALGDGQNLNWGSEKKVKIITNNNNCNSIYHKSALSFMHHFI